MMAFVTLEDLQGLVELVVFPRTWEQYSELLEPERIVMVEGRVDAASGDPKVLVDSVSTEFKAVVSVENPPNSPLPASKTGSGSVQTEKSSTTVPRKAALPKPDNLHPQPRQVAPPPSAWDASIPPPPDAFPPDWIAEEVVPGGFVLEGGRLSQLPVAVQPAQLESLDEFYVEHEDEHPIASMPVEVPPGLPQKAVMSEPAHEEPAPVPPTLPDILSSNHQCGKRRLTHGDCLPEAWLRQGA